MPEPIVVAIAFKRVDYATAETFQTQLLTALGDGSARVVLDFSGVEAITSVGLRALVVAGKQSKAGGGAIVIAALQPLVREIFVISRFDALFGLYDSVPDAVAALGAR